MTDLNELADRCERADAADDIMLMSLNAAILRAVGWTSDRLHAYRPDGSIASGVPDLVRSIDAATSLFPGEGDYPAVFWRSGHDGEGPDPSLFFAQIMCCENDNPKTYRAVAETEPLARTAAALRARAATPVQVNEVVG